MKEYSFFKLKLNRNIKTVKEPIKVKAMRVNSHGLTFFIFKDFYGWNVTEKSTGLHVTTGRTIKEAKEQLNNCFTSIGVEKIKKLVSEKKEYFKDVINS